MNGREQVQKRACRVFGYSITSSARASSVGGIDRPRAFAVLALISISNCVGCPTDRSDGFAPFSILSTIAASAETWLFGSPRMPRWHQPQASLVNTRPAEGDAPKLSQLLPRACPLNRNKRTLDFFGICDWHYLKADIECFGSGFAFLDMASKRGRVDSVYYQRSTRKAGYGLLDISGAS